MNSDRTSKPFYDSRPAPSSQKSDKDADVKGMWKRYIKKGPLFEFKEFEHALNDLKSQGKDTAYVEQVREIFIEELGQVREASKELAKKIVDKLGNRNITDAQILDYVTKQGRKKGLSDTLVEATVRELSQLLAGRQAAPYFRFRPYKNTKLAETLGFRGQVDILDHFGQSDNKAIKALEALSPNEKLLHSHIITQTLQYQDCAPEAVLGEFHPERHDRYIHIDPVVAALFVPKIDIIQETMLYASMVSMILSRAKNEPIATRPDYELFHNIVYDRNESVCDHADPLNDLRLRAEIQLELWQAVLALRAGRYFDAAGMKLLHKLNSCRFYKYDAADIAYAGGAGDTIRRLFMTFSLRPVRVRTLPVLPANAELQLNATPYVNYELQNGDIESIPMVNIRLGVYPKDSKTVPAIKDVLKSQEMFYDKITKTIIPKMTEIMSTNQILVVYIHRHQLVIPMARIHGEHFTFKDLPKTRKDYYTVSESPVQIDRNVEINKENYVLRSAVLCKTIEVEDKRENVATKKRLVSNGTRALIFPTNPYGMVADEAYVYDPSGVGFSYVPGSSSTSQNKPMEKRDFESYNDRGEPLEDSLSIRICTNAEIVVFTKEKPAE